MAKQRLTVYDKYGAEVDYDVSTEDVTLDNEDGKSLKTKLNELDDADEGNVKRVTFNGTAHDPDAQGNVSIEQAQADWNQVVESHPSYVKNKPNSVVNEVLYDQQSRKVKQRRNGVVEDVFTLPEGGSSVTVDPQLADSPNPIANAAVNTAVNSLQGAITTLQNTLNSLMNGASVTDAIDTFNEVIDFLDDIDTDDPTLANQLLALNNAITALQNTLSQKANSSDVANTYATKSELTSGLSGKQDTLTFDNAPTAGSNNPVKSGGIKTAIDNVTPTISQNGKWVIGGVESEVDAQGPRGNSILVNENAQGIQALIVNNVVDGGETDILSAEMGKVIRQNIMKIFNALGTYAFPEGKPVLNWGSTVIHHSINTNGVTGGLTISDVEVDGVSVGSLPAQVVEGKSLSLRLALPSNLYVFDDNVSVKMGGVDITSTAFDETTGEINIAAVTDDIVISANALTYVSSGLVSMFDGKNVDAANSQWIDKIDNTRILQLSGCTVASDHVEFDGVDDSAFAATTATGIDVPRAQGTIEAVANGLICNSTDTFALIMANHYAGTPLICMTAKYSDSFGNGVGVNFASVPNDESVGTIPNSWLLGKSSIVAADNIHLSMSDNRAYLNGNALSRANSQAYLTTGNTRKLGICCTITGSGGMLYKKGNIYCVRVYDKQLSSDEILQNYKVDRKRFNLS